MMRNPRSSAGRSVSRDLQSRIGSVCHALAVELAARRRLFSNSFESTTSTSTLGGTFSEATSGGDEATAAMRRRPTSSIEDVLASSRELSPWSRGRSPVNAQIIAAISDDFPLPFGPSIRKLSRSMASSNGLPFQMLTPPNPSILQCLNLPGPGHAGIDSLLNALRGWIANDGYAAARPSKEAYGSTLHSRTLELSK